MSPGLSAQSALSGLVTACLNAVLALARGRLLRIAVCACAEQRCSLAVREVAVRADSSGRGEAPSLLLFADARQPHPMPLEDRARRLTLGCRSALVDACERQRSRGGQSHHQRHHGHQQHDAPHHKRATSLIEGETRQPRLVCCTTPSR
jgi:hypothetical protein